MRVVHGTLKAGDEVVGWQHDAHFRVEEVGHFGIKPIPTPQLAAGEVGYMLANIKTVSEISVGDTITHARRKAARPFVGVSTREAGGLLFVFFPESSDQHLKLRQALEKLRLNDASFTFEPDSSLSLGLGFRCGFLGLLHLEIVQERIAREFNLAVIASAPLGALRDNPQRPAAHCNKLSLSISRSPEYRCHSRAVRSGYNYYPPHLVRQNNAAQRQQKG